MTDQVQEYRDAVTLSRAVHRNDRDGCVDVLSRYSYEKMVRLTLSMGKVTAALTDLLTHYDRLEAEDIFGILLTAMDDE